MKPRDVLELRRDLQERSQGRAFRDYVSWRVTGFNRHAGVPVAEANHAKMFGDNFADQLMLTLERAENFYVGADMMELLAYSAELFDDTDTADVTLAPTDNGFAYFESPFVMTTDQGEIKVRAITWSPSQIALDTYRIDLWADNYSDYETYLSMLEEIGPDGIQEKYGKHDVEAAIKQARKIEHVLGRWAYVAYRQYHHGSPIGPLNVTVNSEEQAELLAEGKISLASNPLRFIHAFWLMMMQPIAEAVKDEKPDRATRRRMAAANLPSDVTIIRFRRRESKRSDEPAKKVDWTHRWVVRGYWKWHWYKDAQKNPYKKRIWIAPCIKGPDDKPLVYKDKIYALVK